MEEEKPKLTRQQQIEQNRKKAGVHRKNAERFREQLAELENSKSVFDAQRVDQVDNILSRYEDESAGKMLDKILQMKDPQNTQLLANIDKMSAAILSENRRAGQLELEAKRLEKEIDEVRYSDQAFDVFEKLGELIEHLKASESCLDELKSLVLACEELVYFQRAVKSGFPKSYEVVCDSFLKPQNLKHLGLGELLERLGNLGTSYGPALLDKQTTRQQDVPLVRDGSSTPTWMKTG